MPTTRSRSRWATTRTSRRCKADVGERLRRNALDKARHEFSDRIIEYAVANATIELPDILVDQEVEVMHDEFRSTLARQGISEPAYLKATEKTEADLHTEFRPRAEQRVKVLLVLSKIADDRGDRRPRRRRRGARSSSPARATRATRRPSPTSSPSAAATSSAARCAGRGPSRRSSTAGSPPTRSTRRCRTSRTTRRRRVDAPEAEAAAAIDATDPGSIPGSIAAAAAAEDEDAPPAEATADEPTTEAATADR